LPEKFTSRGTVAEVAEDDAVALCWAATREQNIETARNMGSEYLPGFMVHLSSSRFFFFRTPHMVLPPSSFRNSQELSVLLNFY
jgi:hypothetical protein